jgi:hypothetical protein
MGYVGKHRVASARRTASALTAVAVLGQACSIEQAVSGPVSLTGDWTTVDPPESLRVAGKEEQKVCLEIIGTVTDIDLESGVVVDGKRHVLGGEAVDAGQTPHALKIGSQGGSTVCLSRAGELPRGPDFSEDVIRLRLRGEPPLEVARVWWHSNDQK